MGHKSQPELEAEIAEARKKIVVGGFYSHYKHPGEKRYQVLDVAIFESTEEICVLYKPLAMDVTWIRTLVNFLEKVEVDGKKIKRFQAL